jgi:hypothetical protein
MRSFTTVLPVQVRVLRAPQKNYEMSKQCAGKPHLWLFWALVNINTTLKELQQEEM